MKPIPQTDGEGITVAVCESLAKFEGLREQWNDLLARSYSESEFLSWDWLYTWAERFVQGHRRLLVLIFSEGSSVIGIAPMYLELVSHVPFRTRELKFLGNPEMGSDYLDIIAEKGKEHIIVQSFLASLFGSYRNLWDILALKEIPSTSPVLLQFLSRLRGEGKYYVVEEGSYCPGVRLPDNFEAYFNHLSSHRRLQYRRQTRILLSNGRVEHIVYKKGQNFDEAFRIFRTLYEQRWEKDFRELFEVLRSYICRNDNSNCVELSLLMVADRPVGGFLHFISNKKMSMYLQAIDREFNKKISIGDLTCGIIFKHAIETGFFEYDFLKGDESYKLRWMNQANRSMNVIIFNNSIQSLYSYFVNSVKGVGKILLR